MRKQINTRAIGNSYEDLACEHLEAAGLVILARNYRVRIGEIDIIARDQDTLVFVEVKYRADIQHGGASYAISGRKQQTIRRVAQWYMDQFHIPSNTFCRFDAVLINGEEVQHIKNAWQ